MRDAQIVKDTWKHEHIVENLPAILAAVSSICAGVFGYASKLPRGVVYRNMCAFLVVCYFLGFVARRMIRQMQA